MPYKDPAVRKAKHAEYSKTYYEKNKTKVIKAAAVNRKKFTADWAAFKATLECTVCKENHPATLDFHHVDPNEKEYSIDRLVRNCSWKTIKMELEKCVVLCANCHRKHHHDERMLAKVEKSSNI